MRFEWDKAKSRSNLLKHGVSFRTATLVFLDPLQANLFDGVLGGEERWRTIGKAGERIISAREATTHERKAYEDEL